jgi:hypothetical protein
MHRHTAYALLDPHWAHCMLIRGVVSHPNGAGELRRSKLNNRACTPVLVTSD